MHNSSHTWFMCVRPCVSHVISAAMYMCHTYEQFTNHVCHTWHLMQCICVTHMNTTWTMCVTRNICGNVYVSHIWTLHEPCVSHVTSAAMSKVHTTHENVMSHTWMSHGSVMSHIWTIDVTHMTICVTRTVYCSFVDGYCSTEQGSPKKGLIALWSATNRWYVIKFVSQKRNRSNDKNEGYNILVNFIFKFI